MKVYQITENEAISLLEQLSLAHMQKANFMRINPDLQGELVNDMHSGYRLVVCRWLQSIGVDRLTH